MANKKINQLVLKTTIQPTDLFPLGDATTGQLFKKTVAELQAAIGGAVISVNGLVGTVVLDTDDIQELASPTNRYFTEARARAAISLTTTGSSGASTYSSSTGVLNVPNYTLAGLGGITASFLSGGTGITYNSGTGVIAYSGTVYTDSSIRALFSAGTGISYNSSTGAISYSGTVYTDASIRALISLTTNGSSGASTYNNTTGVLNVPTYTLAGLGGISLTSLSGSAPITYNSSTGAIGITQASTSTNGFLSSTDWNTFNNKQSTITVGNLTEATSSVLTITGGTGAVIGSGTSIQVKQASSTVSGFLSSTDWSTFNSKQGTITLTTTGTSGAATFSGGTLNIPQYQGVLTNPVTGTGTTNYVTKWTSSSAIGNSQIFDNGTNVGIGTNIPLAILSSANTGALTLNSNDGNHTGFGLFILAPSTINTVNSAIGFGQTSGRKLAAIGLQTYGDSDQAGLNFYIQTTASGSSASLTEAMRITSASNVGIGTSSTGFNGAGLPLVIGSGSGNTGMTIFSGSSSYGSIHFADAETTGNASYVGYINYDHSANSMQFGINNGERMKISSAGRLQVASGQIFGGTSTSDYGSLTLYGGHGVSTNSGSRIEIRGYEDGASTQGAILSYTSNTERMRITQGGNILMGTGTDNGERLYVSGSIRATGSITANSDVRLKKNIERIENALQKVSEISGYTYNTIYDEDRHAGVIAQEIDKVLPEIVNKGNDGLMGVEYGNISALLIEAIKDLKAKNEKLEAIVEGLRK